MYRKNKRKQTLAFTLAEVLITLGIIGVVCAITIPALMNNVNDMQYKTAYKKAYSNLEQSFKIAKLNDEFMANTTTVETKTNFALLQNQFKTIKSCANAVAEGCWVDSCMSNNDCWNSTAAENNQGKSVGFIDSSGTAWIQYKEMNALWIISDINGNKPPNRLGKDRFPFYINDITNNYIGIPYKVTVPADAGSKYYTSWLYN